MSDLRVWLLDPAAPEYVDQNIYTSGSNWPHLTRRSPLCLSSFLAEGQRAPSTLLRSDSSEQVPDPYFPAFEKVAGWLESLHGSGSAFEAQCAVPEAEGGPNVWACRSASFLKGPRVPSAAHGCAPSGPAGREAIQIGCTCPVTSSNREVDRRDDGRPGA